MTDHWVCSKSHTMCATSGAGTDYPAGAPTVYSKIRVAKSLVFCVVLVSCRSLFVIFLLAIVLPVLRSMDSDYYFGIFKPFLERRLSDVMSTHHWWNQLSRKYNGSAKQWNILLLWFYLWLMIKWGENTSLSEQFQNPIEINTECNKYFWNAVIKSNVEKKRVHWCFSFTVFHFIIQNHVWYDGRIF